MPDRSNGKRGRPPDSDPKYRRVSAAIRAELRSGRLAPGDRLPSLRALAAKHDVSYRTAWLAVDALKREGLLSGTARRRITVLPPGERSAAIHAPILEVVSYSKLGPALENPIGWGLHLGVGAGADEIDAPLLTVHGMSLRGKLPEGFAGISPRGVLLLGHFKREVLRLYARTGLPTVLVDWPAPSWKGSAVYVDNHGATRDAVQRLLAVGHRHIAFMQRVSLRQGDLDLDAKERALSLRKALREAGAPHRRESAFTVSFRDDEESPALARLLRARPAFTAVVTSDGGQASKLIFAAEAMGLSVPGDLSVVSFGAEEEPAHSHLSGPVIDFEAMGLEAVRLLKIPANTPRQLRLSTRWRSGETVGPPVTT
jgi:DNA-binding transcriptional regulator YhcF (GntR family)